MHPMIKGPLDRVTSLVERVGGASETDDIQDLSILSAYIENLEQTLARLTTAPELRTLLREASEAAWKGEPLSSADPDEE